MLRMLTTVVWSVACVVPAVAMVGGAPDAEPAIARRIALIVGSRGTACTGVVIARDLVLTAAHCVLPGADYNSSPTMRRSDPSFSIRSRATQNSTSIHCSPIAPRRTLR